MEDPGAPGADRGPVEGGVQALAGWLHTHQGHLGVLKVGGEGANGVAPASHGGHTVALVLQDAALKAQWIAELDEMRARIKEMRQKFVDTLKEKGAKQDFGFIIRQNGMFSFSGLTPEQVDRLKDEFAIYAVRSGRINVAGITNANIGYLCESIVKVL